MHVTLLLVVAAFAQLGASPGASSTTPSGDPTYRAIIRAANNNDIRIHAEVEGLVTKLAVSEGAYVKRGDLIATIDDRTAQAAVDVARSSFLAADQRAKDDIEEKYARAAALVAEADYDMGRQANANGQQAISLIDMKKKKLDWDRAELQIEKAQKDQVLARFEADVKAAELRANEIALTHRSIYARFDGVIQDMVLHEAEWVNPGDPIMRLVRFDVMWVEAWVKTDEYDPSELQGRPVTVRITLARKREAAVQGRIIYVNQSTIDTTGGYAEYLVRAEIQNQRNGDFWLVRPGLPARMDIHVTQPAIAAAAAMPAAAAR